MDWLKWILIGVVVGVVLMVPVTRILLKRARDRARLAERRARDAERLAELGAMTGGLAHEIKNPLSTVGLNAQLLAEAIADSNLPKDERDRLLRRIDALSREIDRLRGILTDFLQFAGRVNLETEKKDLVQIIADLCDFYQPQCDQSSVVLRTQMPSVPVLVQVDESLFKQALLNLMINATQVMSANSISSDNPNQQGTCGELMLRVETDNSEARLHVIDTGPGIDSKRLKEIFHPYVSHQSGGTGLGLPTARRIIEEHDGRLEVHSELGKGSDFVIHLPLSS